MHLCFRPFARVWLELELDVDDERGADRGEQTGLKMWLIHKR